MNLPNQLTALRILMTPVFAWIFFMEGFWPKLAALLLSLFSEATDVADGVIARRRNLVTDFGKLADPLADSVSRFTFALCIVFSGWGELWMLLVLFYRDSLVAVLRTFSAAHNIVMAARLSGKIKAFAQGFVINLVLLFIVFDAWSAAHGTPIRVGSTVIGSEFLRSSAWWALVVMSAVTAWSAVDYTLGARDVLRKMKY